MEEKEKNKIDEKEAAFMQVSSDFMSAIVDGGYVSEDSGNNFLFLGSTKSGKVGIDYAGTPVAMAALIGYFMMADEKNVEAVNIAIDVYKKMKGEKEASRKKKTFNFPFPKNGNGIVS